MPKAKTKDPLDHDTDGKKGGTHPPLNARPIDILLIPEGTGEEIWSTGVPLDDDADDEALKAAEIQLARSAAEFMRVHMFTADFYSLDRVPNALRVALYNKA